MIQYIETPNVLVLLPTHNRFLNGHLSRSIESILGQDHSNLQLVIIDDGSSDGTSQEIAKYIKKDKRVSSIRFDQNVGLPSQTGAVATLGRNFDYLAWAFDDSIWHSNHLTSLVRILQQNSNSHVAYGKAKLHINGKAIELGQKFNQKLLHKRNFIPNCATLIRKELFNVIGWFDPTIVLKRINDWDFWIRASAVTNFEFVDSVIAEEFGPELGDSLGRSVVFFENLAQKQMNLQRNNLLALDKIGSFDPFTPGFPLTQRERAQWNYATIQHFSRTKNLNELPKKFLLSEKPIEENWIKVNEKIFLEILQTQDEVAGISPNNLTQNQKLILNAIAWGVTTIKSVLQRMNPLRWKKYKNFSKHPN